MFATRRAGSRSRPGEPQAIRVSAAPAAELPDGEYRVHMSLSAVPKVRPVAPRPKASASGGLLDPDRAGLRHHDADHHPQGRSPCHRRARQPALEQGEQGPAVHVSISPVEGDASIYGDLLVYSPEAEATRYSSRAVSASIPKSPRAIRRSRCRESRRRRCAACRADRVREPIAKGGALLAALDTVLR
jgi:hypothetical protein